MDSSVSLVVLSRFSTVERVLSYELPHLIIWASLLTELDHFNFSFTSSCFLLFLATMRHRAYFTAVIVEILSLIAPLMINNVIVNYERSYSP